VVTTRPASRGALSEQLLAELSRPVHPLPSIDYATRERSVAHVERSDVCVLPAAGVVGEAMVAIVLADALRVKFGGDSLDDALESFRSFQARHG